jgi:phosphoribosylformimino-5-aminoimidazole carboxamide ribotide isomerase
MIIYPAIDLRRGRCVRLRQGRRDQETVYGDDPVQVAKRWVAEGASWLHVVNLDGAFGEGGEADSPNLTAVRAMAEAVSVPIQFGGGMRSWVAIERALDLGVQRIILGTVAIERPALLERALERFGPERVAVGIDARDGRVLTHGWEETSEMEVIAFGGRMADVGVTRVIYTDVSRDGMLTGVNVAATAALAEATGLNVIASGGVSSLDDVRRLREVDADIEGAIIGKALYTGDVILGDAIRVGKGQ